ncbi:MAG TPA: alpha/beta hydrolase [Caulobacteraceae bacterium]|nr:alpha/beta hydrolase [Caulobacteraceae bacterium]
MAITQTRFRYHGTDGAPLAGFLWRSEDVPANAVLQLAHGAGEHSGRYVGPLTPIIEAGFVVYSADHRGHGLTSGMTSLGDFGPGGAVACVEDMAALSRRARAEQPGLPLFLMGHSMGAMFAQSYILDHSDLIDALVLSGTTGPGPLPAGDLNAGYTERRTDYDWLSRDPAEVDKYIADPFCGIRFTEASRASFLALREDQARTNALDKVRSGLPVYVVVGDDDPINHRLEGLEPLLDAYRAGGLDVTLKVWPGGRHEMLNEINRDGVVADLLGWLNATVAILESDARHAA